MFHLLDYCSTRLLDLLLLMIAYHSSTTRACNEFMVEPVSVVQAEGLGAVFECFCPGAFSYVWSLNGTRQSTFPSGITAISPTGEAPARLNFTSKASLEYNSTVVQCVVQDSLFSENASLLVRRIQQPVVEFTEDSVTVSWNNEFTTNVSFCVHISGGFKFVVQCENYTQEHSTFALSSIIRDLCSGLDLTFYVSPTLYADGEQHAVGKPSESMTTTINASVNIYCLQTGEEPTICHLQFGYPLMCTFKMQFYSNDELPVNSHFEFINGNGSVSYEQHVAIPPNRRFSVEVEINSSFVLPKQSVSTHDIVIGMVNDCSREGALNTTCSFVENTLAQGYLAIVSKQACNVNKDENIFLVSYNTADESYDILDGVGNGSFKVVFFDIEQNGLPTRSTVPNDIIMLGSASTQEINLSTGARDSSLFVTQSLSEVTITESPNGSCCVSCLANVDCLLLLYDCETPQKLLSLIIPLGNTKCFETGATSYSIAVFGIDSSSDGTSTHQLSRHPGKQFFVSHTSSAETPSTAPTKFEATMTRSATTINGLQAEIEILASVCATCAFVAVTTCMLVIVGLVLYKRRKRSRTEYNGSKECHKNSVSYSAHSTETSQRDIYQDPFNEGDAPEDVNPDFEIPEPTYATADNKRVMVKKARDAQSKPVNNSTTCTYADIKGHMHEAQVYAHVEVKTPEQGVTGDQMDVLEVQYAVLDETKLVTEVEPMEDKEPPPEVPRKPTPVNADNLLALLTPAANKWYEIGLAMGFSQSTLENEVQPGNSTDWLRLGEVVASYCCNRHCWEEVVHILWGVEELELADKICRQEGLQVERPGTQDETVPPPPYPSKHTP